MKIKTKFLNRFLFPAPKFAKPKSFSRQSFLNPTRRFHKPWHKTIFWWASWQKILVRSFYGASYGNKIHYFDSGTKSIQFQWRCIKKAQKSIYFEMYTLEPDAVGNKTLQLLKEASARGVKVVCIFDHFGSSNLKDDIIADLIQSGIKTFVYNKITFLKCLKLIKLSNFDRFTSFLFRNHRKTLITDDKIAVIASCNHGVKYADSNSGGNGRFRDSGCCVFGPAVIDIKMNVKKAIIEAKKEFLIPSKTHQNSKRKIKVMRHSIINFLRQRRLLSLFRSFRGLKENFNFHRFSRKKFKQKNSNLNHFISKSDKIDKINTTSLKTSLKINNSSLKSENNSLKIYKNKIKISKIGKISPFKAFRSKLMKARQKKTRFLQVLVSARRRGQRKISESLIRAINCAVKSIYITNPYFLPSRRVLNALIQAAKRGVDLKLLTTGESDVPLAKFAAQIYYVKMLQSGGRIFELQNQILHAKTVVIDGIYSSFGTFNFDEWSEFRNLELNVKAFNTFSAAELTRHFEADLRNSVEIKMSDFERQSVFKRAFCYFCLFLAKSPKFLGV